MATEDKFTVERLDVDNYATWSIRMRALLITKGLWGAVTGDSIDPDKDQKALTQIILHVKDHHLMDCRQLLHLQDCVGDTQAHLRGKDQCPEGVAAAGAHGSEAGRHGGADCVCGASQRYPGSAARRWRRCQGPRSGHSVPGRLATGLQHD